MTLPARHQTAAYWETAEAPDPRLGTPSHPGEQLKRDFLDPLGVSINRFASDLGITYRRAHELVTGKRGFSAETALLLAKYFDMSPQYWLNAQSQYELELLRGKMREKMGRVRPLPRPDLERPALPAAPPEGPVDGEPATPRTRASRSRTASGRGTGPSSTSARA